MLYRSQIIAYYSVVTFVNTMSYAHIVKGSFVINGKIGSIFEIEPIWKVQSCLRVNPKGVF